MAKKLLIDSFGTFEPMLVEDSEQDGHLILRGEFGKADVPTQNRRIYPRHIWEREIRKVLPDIKAGKVMGELDHPADGKTSLKRVGILLTNLWMESDGRIMGEAKVMKNSNGAILESIHRAGGKIGISSRGMGSTSMNEDGYEMVQEDYQYMTHDCVSDPAVKTSYPQISTESVDASSKPLVTESPVSQKEPVMEKNETQVENKEVKTEAKAPESATVKVKSADPAAAEPKKEEPNVEAKEEPKAEEPKAEEPKAEPTDEAKGEPKKEEPKKEEPKMESTATLPAAALTEAQVTQNLGAQKSEISEAFKKELERKLAEQKAAIEKDPTVFGSKLAMEEVAKIVRPFVLPEDVQNMLAQKDNEIERLTAENETLRESAEKSAKVAKRLGMLLHFEQKLAESQNSGAVRKLVGDVRRFSKHTEITEAVKAAESAIKSLTESKVVEAKVKTEVVTKATRAADDEGKLLKEENERLKKSVKESVDLARKYGFRAYVTERAKTNPNLPKMLKLVESCQTKEDCDKLIERFTIAQQSGGEYNSIRNRLAKKVGQNSTLVEDHLREAGHTDVKTGVVSEGVDAEIASVAVGTSLGDIESIGGVKG